MINFIIGVLVGAFIGTATIIFMVASSDRRSE